MKNNLLIISIFSILLLFTACSEEESNKEANGADTTLTHSPQAQVVDTMSKIIPPTTDFHYVKDPLSNVIFEINLKEDKITNRYATSNNLIAIEYDMWKGVLYQLFTGDNPEMHVFDPQKGKAIYKYSFIEPPSAMMFDPIKRELYIVSEDSTHFIVYSSDSTKIIQSFPLHITDKGGIGPITISPGPAGKVITANGDRGSVTQILTSHNYVYQTVINHETQFINSAVFAFDGNSFYCSDNKSGRIYKMAFGTGEHLAVKDKLDNPRSLQLEIRSNIVVVVIGKTDILMLHSDTFREMGKVSLADYGEEILSLYIPPKANFADVIMEYKGARRWIRFDVSNWQPMRFMELI